MKLRNLALKNISGSLFRSVVVALCALLVAGFALTTTLIMRGAENSLNLAMQRLGADIVVVPAGAATRVESALLMGIPAEVWMPSAHTAKIAALPGIEEVSPQLYLSTLEDAACCTVPNMFLVAYDPTTDFTIQPWLQKQIGGELRLGEVVGGTYIFTPEDQDNILLYGYRVTLRANMEPTGTGLDQSMFFTFDTAFDISRISETMAVQPLVIPKDSISAVMVKVAPGQDVRDVAVNILKELPDVTPLESPNMFQSYRKQIDGLLRSILLVLSATWGLSIVLIGLIFSMAANERRRELGVLRALGATRSFVMRSLLAEAGILAFSGGLIGVLLAGVGIFLFRRAIVETIGIPFLFPSAAALFQQVGLGLALAVLSVTLAALLPAYRISRMDPAVAMRE
ncbi:MAG: FtsX-like permease family protein [Chloroflexi bacterium]|nr:FtsX-like permease family protein [Chloroflexota bacterium]